MVFILSGVLLADTAILKLNDGSVIKGEVKSASPAATEVVVSTEYGVIRVPVAKISPESRKALGIGQPATTAQYEARIAELEAENAQLRQAVVAAEDKLTLFKQEWQKGSDRATCLINIRNVQQAIRGYQNLKHLKEGDPIPWNEIFGNGGYTGMDKPTCPVGGPYTFVTTIPKIGSLACKCSHTAHMPPAGDYSQW